MDWPVYGGGPAGDHFSPLTQVNAANAKDLQVAWTFDTGEAGQMETSPIVVGRVLYAATTTQKIFALDAATGTQLWRFSSGIHGTQPIRGVSYWHDGDKGRILAGVMNYLYELDAATGKPIPSFGNGGRIDLRENLDAPPDGIDVALTTPGVIFGDIIILGDRLPETHPAAHGDVRAYDLHTGKLRWSFHTIPHPGEPGYETWTSPDAWKTAGAANNWAGMAIDTQRGIVYVPTGSAVDDFYGADRKGKNLYADCLLALDARTGNLLWHFQGVHHDLWDRDFPAPPILLTVKREGRNVDAIAQTTKQGYVYVFDRVTGKPLFPIEERPYPQSDVPGESSWPTQPLPLTPAPISDQTVTEQTLTTRTPEAHEWALKEFRSLRSEGQFVPLNSRNQTLIMPGFDGGAEWGGAAIDRASSVLYVNAINIAYTGGLEEAKSSQGVGASVYLSQCSVCHGTERKGAPPEIPSLIDVTKRLSDEQIVAIIHGGKGRMPAFSNLKDDRLHALLDYMRTGVDLNTAGSHEKKQGPRFRFTGYRKFMDPDGYPATAPPWGTLNAIDLNSGAYLWKIPFGEYPELASNGMRATGSESYGGPIVTAGGVVFIGATIFDRKMHAFDSHTGKLLWEYELPAGALATPATYMVDGQQFVVIAAGGGKNPKRPFGSLYVAFALPREKTHLAGLAK